MTSLSQSTGSVFKSAICKDDIFPVGQPVVVRIPHWKLSSTENRAAASIRYYQSATALLPGCGYGRRWNPLNSVGRVFRAGIARCFSVSAIPALLLSGRRGTSPGVVNLGRLLVGWSAGFLRAPHHACKQAARVLTVLFRPRPFGSLFHARSKAWRSTHDVQRNSASGA